MTDDPPVATATTADRERIVAALVAAFPSDPVLRFLFPGADEYRREAPFFFGHLFDKRVNRATIWTIENGASTAIWEPPAGGDVPAGETGLSAGAGERLAAYEDALHEAMPGEPFWYLGVLGTHPAAAGRRLGRVVMAAGLRRAAEDGLPAVLETSNPSNVALYQRAGWRVAAEFRSPLQTWVMYQ